MRKRKSVVAGVLAGTASGLVGSWLMLHFIEGPGFRLLEGLKSPEDHAQDAERSRQRTNTGQPPTPDSVTMQAADTFARHAPRGRSLTHEERKQAGAVVHYVFGALMGAAYGTAAELTPLPTLGVGALFGTVLWLGTDLLSVPAVGFAPWPDGEPPAAHLTHWLAHLVYGMEGTRRLLR